MNWGAGKLIKIKEHAVRTWFFCAITGALISTTATASVQLTWNFAPATVSASPTDSIQMNAVLHNSYSSTESYNVQSRGFGFYQGNLIGQWSEIPGFSLGYGPYHLALSISSLQSSFSKLNLAPGGSSTFSFGTLTPLQGYVPSGTYSMGDLPTLFMGSVSGEDVSIYSENLFTVNVASRPAHNPYMINKEYYANTQSWLDYYLSLLSWVKLTVATATGSAADVVLSWVAKGAEIIAGLSNDPRVKVESELGKSLKDLKTVVAFTGGASAQQFLVAATATTIVMKQVSKGLGALANDPPRDDFNVATAPEAPAKLGNYDVSNMTGAMADLYKELFECAADASDGNRVALLAAERAWGAGIAGDFAARKIQGDLYLVGATKANAAMSRCQAAMGQIEIALQSMAIHDINLRQLYQADSSQAALDQAHDILVSSGLYSESQIDIAMAEIARENANAPNIGLFSAFSDLDSIPSFEDQTPIGLSFASDSVTVPEPATIALMLLAFGAMGAGLRRRKLHCLSGGISDSAVR